MKKLLQSFGYAIRGILVAVKNERNLQIHIVISLAVVIAGFVFSISSAEWIACILCMGLVIGAELINTAIEELVNAVSPERSPVFGQIKDIAAGAVFFCAFISVVTGIIIFLPKLIILIL
jgi:diacylglycerol kinase (ATP)